MALSVQAQLDRIKKIEEKKVTTAVKRATARSIQTLGSKAGKILKEATGIPQRDLKSKRRIIRSERPGRLWVGFNPIRSRYIRRPGKRATKKYVSFKGKSYSRQEYSYAKNVKPKGAIFDRSTREEVLVPVTHAQRKFDRYVRRFAVPILQKHIDSRLKGV